MPLERTEQLHNENSRGNNIIGYETACLLHQRADIETKEYSQTATVQKQRLFRAFCSLLRHQSS